MYTLLFEWLKISADSPLTHGNVIEPARMMTFVANTVWNNIWRELQGVETCITQES